VVGARQRWDAQPVGLTDHESDLLELSLPRLRGNNAACVVRLPRRTPVHARTARPASHAEAQSTTHT